jgi:hypothetical protein
MHAARRKSTFATKVLLLLQADVNAKNEDGATALFYAAANGRWANVELLLNAGADVSVQDRRGMTPLCAATYFAQGDMRSMQLLPDHEASPAAAATAALRCLGESHNRVNTLRLLITKGGDPRIPDRKGEPF